MHRRTFIKYLLSAPIIAKWDSALANSVVQTSSESTNQLQAQQMAWNLFPQQKTAVPTNIWSFSQQTFAKPLYAQQGQETTIKVSNHLAKESIGVHWHGLRIPNNMDGVPNLTQSPIKPKGGTFEYKFTPPDAGTFWYHTHSNSVEQLERGLLGPLIIKENTDYAVDDDRTILLKDWRLNKDFQINTAFYNRHDMAHEGRLGNVVTVNGLYQPTYQFNHNSRVRLRLINASNARIFALDFSDFERATVIALDGYPVNPHPYQPAYLAPGMRIDIVVDIATKNKVYSVFDTLYEKHNLVKFQTNNKSQRSKIFATLPNKLPDNPITPPNIKKAIEHTVTLEGGAMSMGMMRGMMMGGSLWTINGKSMSEKDNDTTPLLTLKKDQSYIFNIQNNTRFAHPIHLHGHTFKVLTAKQPYWSDTAFLLPDKTAKIAFVADNPGLWMFHCHILGHQSSGMMGVIEVT